MTKKTIKIEQRTLQFIQEMDRLKDNGHLPGNDKLATIIGVSSKSTISEIRGHRQNIQPEQWVKFKDHFKIKESASTEYSVSHGTRQSYLEQRRDQKQNGNKNRIPFYEAEAEAGIKYTEMSPIHAPAGTIDIGDLLHDSESAIRIYGNNMLPNYPPGCVVGLIKCTTSFIEPGEIYVIETRDRRMLKRLFYKNEDTYSESFMCYSDNTMKFEGGARDGKFAYPPFELKKGEIINLFVVTGVIKRNSNSVIINRS